MLLSSLLDFIYEINCSHVSLKAPLAEESNNQIPEPVMDVGGLHCRMGLATDVEDFSFHSRVALGGLGSEFKLNTFPPPVAIDHSLE